MHAIHICFYLIIIDTRVDEMEKLMNLLTVYDDLHLAMVEEAVGVARRRRCRGGEGGKEEEEDADRRHRVVGLSRSITVYHGLSR